MGKMRGNTRTDKTEEIDRSCSTAQNFHDVASIMISFSYSFWFNFSFFFIFFLFFWNDEKVWKTVLLNGYESSRGLVLFQLFSWLHPFCSNFTVPSLFTFPPLPSSLSHSVEQLQICSILVIHGLRQEAEYQTRFLLLIQVFFFTILFFKRLYERVVNSPYRTTVLNQIFQPFLYPYLLFLQQLVL